MKYLKCIIYNPKFGLHHNVGKSTHFLPIATSNFNFIPTPKQICGLNYVCSQPIMSINNKIT